MDLREDCGSLFLFFQMQDSIQILLTPPFCRLNKPCCLSTFRYTFNAFCLGLSLSSPELKTESVFGQWTRGFTAAKQRGAIITLDLLALLLLVQASPWLALHHCEGTLLTHTVLHVTPSSHIMRHFRISFLVLCPTLMFSNRFFNCKSFLLHKTCKLK